MAALYKYVPLDKDAYDHLRQLREDFGMRINAKASWSTTVMNMRLNPETQGGSNP